MSHPDGKTGRMANGGISDHIRILPRLGPPGSTPRAGRCAAFRALTGHEPESQPATSLTRSLPVSEISTSLPGPVITASGPLSEALVAGPPSPEKPTLPLPATV